MDEPAVRVFSRISDLGFQAAEIRAPQARLADACARQEMDVLADLAEDLIARHAKFAQSCKSLLAALPVATSVWLVGACPPFRSL